MSRFSRSHELPCRLAPYRNANWLHAVVCVLPSLQAWRLVSGVHAVHLRFLTDTSALDATGKLFNIASFHFGK